MPQFSSSLLQKPKKQTADTPALLRYQVEVVGRGLDLENLSLDRIVKKNEIIFLLEY